MWKSKDDGLSFRSILSGKGFYISYNSNPGTGLFSGDCGPETALCYIGRFDILNGDFREQYEKVFPGGLEACKKFFDDNKEEYGSSWTTPEEESDG